MKESKIYFYKKTLSFVLIKTCSSFIGSQLQNYYFYLAILSAICTAFFDRPGYIFFLRGCAVIRLLASLGYRPGMSLGSAKRYRTNEFPVRGRQGDWQFPHSHRRSEVGRTLAMLEENEIRNASIISANEPSDGKDIQSNHNFPRRKN